ncbi:MAG: aldo/keto reductase [Candidatus Odinarchaeota archaeon]
MLLGGHTTPEGTKQYATSMIGGKKTCDTHFREFNGLYLSSLGIGTYLGGIDSSTDKLVTEALVESMISGINVLDTAINYRRQRAERSVGRALKAVTKEYNREQFFISTKNGYIPGDGDLGLNADAYIKEVVLGKKLAFKDEIINYNSTALPYLEHQLEQSLNNLGLETIDLLYLHNVAESQKGELGENKFYEMITNCFQFYEEQIATGRLKYYGLATWDCFRVPEENPSHVSLEKLVDLSKKALDSTGTGNDEPGFRFVQLPFNLVMQEAKELKNQAGKTVFEKAAELGIGLFASVPIFQGRILGDPFLKELVSKVSTHGRLTSPAQVALQLVREEGLPLIAPLIGHKRPEHVKENLKLVEVPPSDYLN